MSAPDSEDLCMACGEQPAAPGSGPVKLCSACKSLAAGKSRGVEYQKPEEQEIA